MTKLAGSGTTALQTFQTGVVPISWRFTFLGPGGATVPMIELPYATLDPVQVISDPVPVAGDWTVSFSAVDAVGTSIGPVITATANVPADVVLRVAKGLTLQVISG